MTNVSFLSIHVTSLTGFRPRGFFGEPLLDARPFLGLLLREPDSKFLIVLYTH